MWGGKGDKMSIVWTSIVIVCLGTLLITNPAIAFSSILSGAEKTIALSLKLWGIYAIWLGILNIIQETGLDKKIARLLSPLIDRLIGKTDPATKGQIAMNITGNIFGMGNASTPSGIAGMAGLDKGSERITAAMAMFFILNTTSVQIIPSTLISLRALAGSQSPNDIILPAIISSFSGLIAGIVMIKLCAKLFKGKKNSKTENANMKKLAEKTKGLTGNMQKNLTERSIENSEQILIENSIRNAKQNLVGKSIEKIDTTGQKQK